MTATASASALLNQPDRASLRDRLRNSAVAWELRRSWVWKWLRMGRIGREALRGEFQFYRDLLKTAQGVTILDVGANVGGKSEIFRRLADHVVAIEPDPTLAQLLTNRFRWRRNVTVLPCAVSDVSGTLEFNRYPGHEAYNTAAQRWADNLSDPDRNRMHLAFAQPEKVQVSCTTVDALMAEFPDVKYLKVDVEGLELRVVSRLASPPSLISLEFNLPDFEDEFRTSVARLAEMDPRYRFNVAIAEPPRRLELPEWLPADALIDVVTRSGWGYAEVYGRVQA